MDRLQHISATDPFEGASVVASTTDTSGSTPIASSAPSAIATGNPGTGGRGRIAGTRHKIGRSVAWSDRGRKKSVEMGKYTFYREGTPPPDGKPLEVPIVVGAAGAPEPYDYKYDHIAPPAPIPIATVCGVSRRLFWMILAAVLIVLALAIGIGVGVGVGTGGGGSDDAPDAQRSGTSTQSSTEAPSATTTIITTAPTSTTSSTSTQASASTVTANPAITTLVTCPAANNTEFRVPGTQTTFLRLCGIDYSGRDSAEDLAHAWTPTMEDCIITCAGYTGCEACSWGILEDDPGSYHRCWMKRNLRRSRTMRAGWDFAVLQEQEED
ncbi:hypothetical protein S40285_10050 [Stachybotrys chlorohalonatus IBT 40285]|uniref:Apple domain-containing protein n=1 Tax=Stachybotrys chlorohalonatus (strain IBT 40285) TaxID=1283841 RepID=A0A084QK85_STAC4|nr:hypothetical protein S40285_10050 [Stachybotrys chlorohalonata IBT 40285]